jgi:hypothetical protein
MTLSRHRLTILAALLLAASVALLAAGAVPARSASTRTCHLTSSEQDPPGDVPTYNLTLKAKGSSCTTAKKVMKAFHKCRSATGFVCTKKLLAHWTCSGHKTSGTPVLFYANFTCKWGTRRVTSSYQQNT